MERDIKRWQVENVSQGGPPIPLSSISQAIEMLVEISKKEMGQTLDFLHTQRGAIICTVGKGQASLTFVPEYDKTKHSLAGKRNARSSGGSAKFYHVDSTGSVSSIPPHYLLPILDVVRALVYIFEFNDVPRFLEWSDPVPDEL